METKPKTVLMSVADKTGIVEDAKRFKALEFTIYGSKGSAEKLNANGVDAIDLKEIVGGDPILDHRLATISRNLYAGFLADRAKSTHMETLKELGVPAFDVVFVDFYHIKDEIARAGSDLRSVIEKTDVGGPMMVHAAVKGRIPVACNVADRKAILDWLEAGKPNEEEFISTMCAKAELYVADYILTSALYLGGGTYFGLIGEKIHQPRYGENPQQKSLGLFKTFGGNDDPLSLDKFKVIAGKFGHINWIDTDRMLQTITHIVAAYHKNNQGIIQDGLFVAVGVKHGNACGAATAGNPKHALQKMLDGNLLSIFGGSIMTNFCIDSELADIIRNYHSEGNKRLLDVIVAPEISDVALEILKRKNDACKMSVNPALADIGSDSMDTGILLRPVRGGFLAQKNYSFVLDLYSDDVKIIAGSHFEGHTTEMNLALAWAICATSTSNTITLVKDGMLIGNGVGQQDRKECCELAIKRAHEAGHITKGAVACSDSFFPFTDGPKVLINAGIVDVLTTSGSIHDKEVITMFQRNDVSLWTIPNTLGRGFYGH